MQRAEDVHRLEAPPSAPPAGGGKATWQPRAWGLGSGPCPRLSGTLSCLASLPSTQIIGADGSSSASYLRRTLAKCVPGSWDGSPPRQPSSGKFFRKLDSGCVGLPPSLFFRKAPARPWEAQSRVLQPSRLGWTWGRMWWGCGRRSEPGLHRSLTARPREDSLTLPSVAFLVYNTENPASFP